MKLTQNQIQDLYVFTKKHFVEWYDLQTELVDHLANDIEHIWQQEPNLSFQQARDKAFKKFGIFGFGEVIEQKQKELTKYYRKLIWKNLRSYFKIPKIMLTALLILLLYILLDTIPFKSELTASLWLIFALVPLILIYIKTYFTRKKQKKTGKKWLFQHICNSLGGITYFPFLPVQIYYSFNFKIAFTPYTQFLLAFIFVLFAIFFYVAIKIIPKKLEEEAAKLYPEYNLS